MSASVGTVRVVDPGALTTIQDAHGRPGFGRLGVPRGGALDPAATVLANRLTGTDARAPVLELTVRGPTLTWESPAHVALAGADLGAVVDGRPLPPGHSYRLPPGARLTFAPAVASPSRARGVRAYLAVEGGFAVAPVLGSAATDIRAGFGGHDGRALRAGDVLRFSADQSGPLRSVRPSPDAVDRAAGPDDDAVPVIPVRADLGWFDAAAVHDLLATAWSVSPASDRTGVRLEGGRIRARVAGIRSVAVPTGAIQVPPGGEPIVAMADGPVTGGYPVIAVVPRFALRRLAQASPASPVRFARVSVAGARRLAAAVAQPALEVVSGDFAADWAR